MCLLPLVAGFVGADAVAVALATRIGRDPRAAHRGGHRHQRRGAAGLARPAVGLLGARRAPRSRAPSSAAACARRIGAIDRVGSPTGDLRVHTLGDAAAQGLCGSGVVDAVAALLDLRRARLDGAHRRGRPRPASRPLRARVQMRGEERLVVLARPGEAGAEREIVLTQDDVRQVQLCKGAIASGVALLQHVAGVGPTRTWRS